MRIRSHRTSLLLPDLEDHSPSRCAKLRLNKNLLPQIARRLSIADPSEPLLHSQASDKSLNKMSSRPSLQPLHSVNSLTSVRSVSPPKNSPDQRHQRHRPVAPQLSIGSADRLESQHSIHSHLFMSPKTRMQIADLDTRFTRHSRYVDSVESLVGLDSRVLKSPRKLETLREVCEEIEEKKEMRRQ